MALDYDVLDHGAQLLGWSTDTPAGQQRMAADLKLLAEVEQLTAEEGRRAPGLGMALQQASEKKLHEQ